MIQDGKAQLVELSTKRGKLHIMGYGRRTKCGRPIGEHAKVTVGDPRQHDLCPNCRKALKREEGP